MTAAGAHPIHSRPNEELMAAGVTKEQIDSLRSYSSTVLGAPDRLVDVLGYPDSRGDASTMLGAFHAIRSKNPPMPGKQAEYAEKIKAAINSPTVEVEVRRREETPVADTQKKCRKCKESKPADREHFGRDKRTSDGLGRTCSDCKATTRNAGQKPSDTKPAPARRQEPATTSADAWTVFDDPRISDVRTLQEILETTVVEVGDIRIDEAVEVLQAIGDAFRPKGST